MKHESPAAPSFLEGGGEMGGLMRAMDWSQTGLGPVQAWPQSLRTAVSILLNSRYPMFIFWGPQLIKIYNDGYRPITGDKHPWALGRPGPEVWPEIWSDIGPMVERVVRDGEATWSEDLRLFMRRRGFPEEVFFTFSYSPIRDESGGVGGMFCACTETTAKVLGERRLKLLRDLAAGAAQARDVAEACAVSARVLGSNPHDVAFAEIDPGNARGWPLGLHPVEALKRQLGEVPPGPWAEPPRSVMVLPLPERALENPAGALAVGLSSRLAFDDAYRDFLQLVAGEVAASLSNARAYDAERKRAEALAEIDRAKTAFFSNVSHEFRTPLTLMLGPVEDGLADREAPLPPPQRARLELARRSALRLQKLVNALLDFSRIEAGRAQASYAPTELAALTADIASSFRSAVEKAGLELVVDCPPLEEPAYVDRDMWEKIVLNLLSNAFKFTFAGRIAVSLKRRSNRFELEVRDTGGGIPAAELPRVFERFRRVPETKSRTHEGTGIGLALVQELVKLHGGWVRAESTEGEGSAFTVSIPAGSAHLAPERIGAPRALASTAAGAEAFVEEALRWLPDTDGAPEPAETGRRERIVWADDNADMRDYVRRLLAPRYEVVTVADGEAALAAARRQRPDLVLADVMMPKLDGLGLVRALRADPATVTVPAILLSARAGEDSRIEGLDAGADAYIYKPFSAKELLARVASRLELSRMQERLLQERADLAGLFAQTPVPIAVLRGESLVFEMANPAYLQVVGGRPVVGKSLSEALPEAKAQGFDELLHGVMRSGTPYIGHETRMRLERNGRSEDAYFTFIYAPLRGEHGQIDGVIAIVNEVTEQVTARRKVEALAEQARASQQELSEFVENATIAMHWVGPDGTILWANRAELELLGYSREEYVGRHIADFHADREVIDDILHRLRRDEKLNNYEARLRRKDGEIRDVVVSSSVLRKDGKFVHTRCFTRDITLRKRAQLALEESEARYRDIFRAAGVSIWEEDFSAVKRALDGLKAAGVADFRRYFSEHPEFVRQAIGMVKVVNVNEATLRMFGARDKDELTGSLASIFVPETETVFAAELLAIAEGRTSFESDAVARTLRGERRDVLFNITFPPPPGASFERVLVTLTDITARRRSEEALRASEERYRRLVALLPVGVYTCEAPSGVINFHNEQAVALWGRAPRLGDTEERFCGSHKLWRPDGRALPHAETPMAIAVREGRGVRNQDVVIERPDGSRITALVNIDPIRDERGVLTGAINVFHDTTVLKEAQDALRRSEAQLETELADARLLQELSAQMIQEENADAIYERILDAAVAIMRSEYASLQMLYPERGSGGELRLLAFRGFDANAARFWEWVRADSESTCGAALRSGARVIAADVESCEFMAGSEDLATYLSTGIHAVQTTPLVSRGGKMVGMISTHWRAPHQPSERDLRLLDILARQAADLLERKAAEQALREGDRRKDEFIAMLSHELRNPLAPISNAVTLLKDAHGEAQVREQAIAILERQTRQMIRLVDDLLDISRISRGSIGLRREPVELAAILDSALETSRPHIVEAEHRLEVSVPGERITLLADAVRMAQVIANLLNNAAKYTPRGGAIELVARPAPGSVAISVRDNGVGIAPDWLPRVFEMFSQGEATRRRVPGGLGIGLGLARKLVELHGGTIEARSAGPGQGSEFTVRMPVLASSQALVLAPPAQHDTVTSRRILIVDDNADAAESLGMVLEQMGHAVRVARDGHAALAAAQRDPPELILADIGLPDLDGFALAARLRQDRRFDNVPIIAVTGYGHEIDRKRARQAGFDEHLVKPVDPALLRTALQMVDWKTL